MNQFKTLESDGKLLHVDIVGFSKAPLSEQVAFVADKTKEGYNLNICEFPRLSLSNLSRVVSSYKENPALTLVSLDNTIETNTPEEKEIVNNFKLALGVFCEAFEALTDLSISKYDFATVPTNYDLDKNFKFLVSSVRRTNDSEHFLSNQNVKSLMNECMDHWESESKSDLQLGRVSLQAHPCNRDVIITQTAIHIGCQTIQRYELEQIAVRLGFKGEKFENIPNLK